MVSHAEQKRMHMSMFMYTMSTGVDAQMLCHAKLEMYTHVHAHARNDAQV